jgi:alpha-N-arabinofuranosidase
LSGSVVIPAGALAADVFVSPLGGNLPTNFATVTLSLIASTNYAATNPASATVTILDRPLDAWRRANFTAGQLANPQISGDSAEPAGDGLSNLIKYAMGLPPLVPATNVLNPQILNGYLDITYSRSLAARDVAITLETSTNLTSWQTGPAYFQQLNVIDQVTNQIVTAQATAPVSAGSKAFVRFVVTKL